MQWIKDSAGPKLRRVSVIGAKGSGKSTTNFEVFFRLILASEMHNKKLRILLTCGTRGQVVKLLKEKLWDDIEKFIPLKASNFSNLEFEFAKGTVLHLHSVETFKKAEGIGYHVWFADEFQDHSKEAADTFFSRTRLRIGENEPLLRIVGMPDDPEHFQYKWLEDKKFILHEITLEQNPDKDFSKRYEAQLRETYFGAELDRFLYGKRVSLNGLGLFAVNQSHRKNVDYNPEKPIMFCWDFNNEYRAVTVWQWEKMQYNCIYSLQMKEVTVQEDAIKICEQFANHQREVYLHGDASGNNKSAQTSESMWINVKKEFVSKFGAKVRYIVPASNPNVKDTIQCVNFALSQNRVYFSDSAVNAYRALVSAKADKFGEIDKSKDYTDATVKSHEVDTVRYAIWHLVEDFPGKMRISHKRTMI